MDRRFLIGSLIFGALAVPRAASAQPGRKMFRIGILNPGMTSSMVGPQPQAISPVRSCAGCASSATCMESIS